MQEVTLRPGRDRSARRRHPWLLSGGIAREPGEAAAGELVRVVSAEGEVVGHGDYSPRSQIRVRLAAFGKEPPAADWHLAKLAAAVARRASDPALSGTNAVRLANAEGDGLPGLVVDRYDDVAVVRVSTGAMAARRAGIAEHLGSALGVRAVVARDDAAAARRDGFAPADGLVAGSLPEGGAVEIEEHARRYRVDPLHGQKTGFYLDQRDARSRVESLAAGRRVLDLFAYTGGFGAAAARGGAAAVTLVDSSEPALAQARDHVVRNRRDPALEPATIHGDVFEVARRLEPGFDLVIVDPPPLARREADVPRAARAYKDALLQALRLAAPGAFLLFFRCSHHVPHELLRKIAFGAALDARREVQAIGALGAPSDHPVSLDHPEGDYLSGLVLRA
jgi:23S rRNA (cytosine1962-C5)-methyltransferase